MTDARPTARLRVLSVTAELAGVVKTGGLGEVAAALPRALTAATDIRVLLPGYPAVLAHVRQGTPWGTVPALDRLPPATIWTTTLDGIRLLVLDSPACFDRPGTPYGPRPGEDFADNALRFAALSWAAAVISAGHAGPWQPDVLHLHDWPTALAPAYAALLPRQVPTVLTLHNLAYQGVVEPAALDGVGLPDLAWAAGEFWGKFSFLKTGLQLADQLTTVSPTYAQEILTPELGCGLDGVLRERAQARPIIGITNGIEAVVRQDRTQATAQLRQQANLAPSDGPLFAVVARMAHQKGIDLVLDSHEALLEDGGQLVLVGEGERALEERAQALASAYPGRISAQVVFSEALAQATYAGADFLLMPSRFEPCGLSQLHAQAHGCLPVAHATGGLTDTIEDGVTGFLIPSPSEPALQGGIHRAQEVFRDPTRLVPMRSAAMAQDRSWPTSAQAYMGLYAHLCA